MKDAAPVGTKSATASRPPSVNWALLVLGVAIVLNVTGPLLPSSQGELGFGIVVALVTLVAAGGLFAVRRWGYIMAIVVAALNVLFNAPAVSSRRRRS